MDKDIVKAKKFFTDMKNVSQEMLDLIAKAENGEEPSEDAVTKVMGKLVLLQMEA